MAPLVRKDWHGHSEIATNDDMIEEVLNSVRSMDKRLRFLEEKKFNTVFEDHLRRLRRLFQTPHQDLGLPSRISNILNAAGIENIGDLVVLETHELLGIKNFEESMLPDLEGLLQDHGLTFGMDLNRY